MSDKTSSPSTPPLPEFIDVSERHEVCVFTDGHFSVREKLPGDDRAHIRYLNAWEISLLKAGFGARSESSDATALAKARHDAMEEVLVRLHDVYNLQRASAWPHVQGVAMAEKMVRELRDGRKK